MTRTSRDGGVRVRQVATVDAVDDADPRDRRLPRRLLGGGGGGTGTMRSLTISGLLRAWWARSEKGQSGVVLKGLGSSVWCLGFMK